MELVVDTSTVVRGLVGAKRAASPAPFVSSSTPELHHPLPQHAHPHSVGQVCSCKRQRISHPTQDTRSVPARSPRSVIWYDFRDRVSENAGEAREPEQYQKDAISSALTADPQAAQGQPLVCTPPPQNNEMDSSAGSRIEVIDSRGMTNREIASLQQRRLHHCSRGLPAENSKIHNFYTKASIFTPRGIVDFQRVQVDERSSLNLLPWSIAIALDLVLYSDSLEKIAAGGPIHQYCRFNIRLAGVEKAINARVIPGLHTILLGQEWIRSVKLLSDFGNRGYYIPIPLAVEAAEEKPLDIMDTKADEKGIDLNDGDDYDDVDYDDDISSDGLSLDGNPSSDGDLSSSELSLDGEGSVDDDASSGDELLLDDGPSSGDEIILEEEATDEDEDDYESEEGEEGDDDTGDHLQDSIEQFLKDYTADTKAAHKMAEHEPEHEPHLASSLNNQSNRNVDDESIGEPAFNIGESAGQQLALEQERAFSSPHHVEHSVATSPTKSQANGVQTRITKRQSKEITKTLNQISRTLAGQSFKAPVKQLWPEYADTYAAKVPNPIDLGTIEMKVKNDIYLSIDEFRADVILLCQNSVDFNGIEHIITSAALEVRDTILKAISDMEEGKGSTRASARVL